MTDQKWQEWIKNLPSSVKGVIALLTSIIAFVIFIMSNYYLGITIFMGILFISLIVVCLFIIFAKTPPLVQGGQGVYKYERFRFYAIIGFILATITIVSLLLAETTRSFAITAFLGTSTPTPTSTSTSTPTPTATPTPTITSTPTPTPLVEIASINIETSIDSDNNTVYIAQLSIEPLEYGKVQLEAPMFLRIGESGFVRLMIIPDSALGYIPQVTLSSFFSETLSQEFDENYALGIPPNYVLMVDEHIQIYPVMSAKLEGINFEISPSESQTYAVVSSLPVEWIWVITPKKSGYQSLIITITIPVIVSQNAEQIVSRPLENIPIEIFVKSPPSEAAPSASLLPLMLFVLIFIILVLIFIILVVRIFIRRLHPMSGMIHIYKYDQMLEEYVLSLSLPLPSLNYTVFSQRNKPMLKELGIRNLKVRCPDKTFSDRGIVNITIKTPSQLIETTLQPDSSFDFFNLRIVKE